MNKKVDEKEIGGQIGFNAKTGELQHLMDAGIVDPAMVTKSSVRNALSVASTLLTTRVVIVLNPKPVEPQPMMPMR